MNKNNGMSSVIKGIAAGAVVGTATYMMSNAKRNSGSKMKKKAAKMMRTVGTVMENVSYLMK